MEREAKQLTCHTVMSIYFPVNNKTFFSAMFALFLIDLLVEPIVVLFFLFIFCQGLIDSSQRSRWKMLTDVRPLDMLSSPGLWL